ncbi:MAG: type II toxin-antitoxin system PemK/MazF family toxin [Candidatus Anammoxibacter sp.]
MGKNLVVKGKVVLVSFPFDDFRIEKVRPAVCLTNPVGKYSHVVVAFITSRTPEDILQTDIVLNDTEPNFSATGLHTQSTIRLHRLMTIPQNIIRRELGILSNDMMKIVSKKLYKFFDLSLDVRKGTE